MNYFLKKKKWMAWVVLLTFLFTSFMPSNILAGNSVASAEGASQIVENPDGYATISYYKGSGLGQEAELIADANSNDYQASTSKTIEQTDIENEFDITLQVMTTQEMENIKMTQDAAVVIVLDKSNSMKRNSQDEKKVAEEQQRITLATAAVNDFITKYKANTSGKAYLSIVEFAGSVSNYNFGTRYSPKYWVDAKTDLTSDWELRKPTTANSTNINGALQSANTLLSNDVVKDVSNKYVILLTDGAPTTGGTAWDGTYDWRGNKNYTYAAKIIETAESLQNNATVYTIAYGSDAPAGLLESVASDSAYALTSSETENLNLVFEEISKNIKLLSNAWQVTDPMGQHITLLGLYDNNDRLTNKLSYSSNGQSVTYCMIENDTINWNLRITPTDDNDDDSGLPVSYTSYTLKYRVRLDNTFDGFNEEETFATNNPTTLLYAMADENGKVTAGPFTVDFKVPAVKGFLGKVDGNTTINFVKVDADDNTPLEGAQFELKLADTHTNSHTVGSEYVDGVTDTSDANGVFSFSDIPSGHTYTLTETTAPTNHEKGGPWTVEVNYGVVTVKDNAGENVTLNSSNQFVIENEKTTQEIMITKRWVTQEDFAPAVTLELLQDGETFALSSTQSDLPQGVTVEVDKTAKRTYVKLPAQSSNIADQTVTLKVPQGYTYTVQEVVQGINGGYNVISGLVTIDGKNWYVSTEGLRVTNTYIGTTNIHVTKTWVDGNNESETRPGSITVKVMNGTTKVRSHELTAEGNWEYTFADLPKYDETGAVINYTVAEEAVNGYTTSISGYAITNTADTINDKTTVSGSKTWVDGGKTHDNANEITLKLYRSSQSEAKAEVTNAEVSWNGGTYTYSGLAKYDSQGYEYSYSVEEKVVDGYTTSYAEDNANNIINTIAQETITISGAKIWNVPEDIEVPAQIEVQLFRDNSEEPIATAEVSASSADDLIWPYKFTDLEKYNLKDGHAYVYTVEEVPVEGFTTSYNGFDIINTYDRSATTSVHVEKVWNDFGANVGEHPAVTIQLYQGDLLYDTLELSEENGWNATFEKLKRYDANQQPYEYTVQEVPVNGYESSVEETADGFVITNTLLMAEPGKVTVGKTATGDNKPDTDTRYKFELQIQVVRPEGSNVLFDARALSNVTLADAANRLNEAIDAVEDSAVLVTSSSQYQYFLTEKENAFAAEANTLMAVEYHHTSPSAIVFENGQGPVVGPSDLEEEEADYFLALRATIVRELLKLSASYTADEVGELVVELAKAIPLEAEDGYGFAMDQAAVEALITAVYGYNAAAGTLPEPAPSEAPLALQVFLNGSSTPSTLTFVENGETGDYYKVDFWLASGANAVFDIQATSGSAIYYRIVESFDGQTSANHSYTNIFDAVTGQTTSGTAIDFTLFDEGAAMAYTFTNVYTNNTNDGGNTGDGDDNEDEDPVTPPSGGGDGYDGPYSDDDTIIDDEEVPLAEPDVDDTDDGIEIDDGDVPLTDVPGEALEIDDEQVPLGDAPKTGDANNAIPFVVLMMMAGLGLAVTRRKFN